MVYTLLFVVALCASVSGAHDVYHRDSPSAINSGSGKSPSCEDSRKTTLATRMLQGYAALQRAVDYDSLLRDALAVLGDGCFSYEELETMVVTVTASHKQNRKDQQSAIRSRKNNDAFQIQDIAPQNNTYADRHIRAMEKAKKDIDCMEGEFDVSSDTYNHEEAIRVLEKCRLVVLRNVYDKDYTQSYRATLGDYVGGLHTGRVSRNGRTTHGQGGFYLKRSPKRWEILLPRNLASEKIIAHTATMDILRDVRILSTQLMVHSTGAVIAESGAVAGHWHADDEYLFRDYESLGVSGIAGHDMPLYAVSMMTPMLDLNYDHGPTEFCVGTSHLKGLSRKPRVVDESLLKDNSPFATMWENLDNGACPPDAWRVPVLGIGDVVLFDYQIIHRGGANKGPDLRAMLYTTYSRAWYRDSNFDASMFQQNGDDGTFNELIASTRFAIPDQSEPCQGDECLPLERISHFMNEQENNDWIETDVTSFPISNRDLAVDALAIYIDDFIIDALPIGKTRFLVDVGVGSKLDIRDFANGHIYNEWTISHKQGQIIVSTSFS